MWAGKLRELGASVPEPGGARLRVRLIIGLARIFGTSSVSDLVQALEGDEEDAYTGQASPEVVAIAADEREHAEIWRRLEGKAAPGAAAWRPGRGVSARSRCPVRGARSGAMSAGTGPASRAPCGR